MAYCFQQQIKTTQGTIMLKRNLSVYSVEPGGHIYRPVNPLHWTLQEIAALKQSVLDNNSHRSHDVRHVFHNVLKYREEMLEIEVCHTSERIPDEVKAEVPLKWLAKSIHYRDHKQVMLSQRMLAYIESIQDDTNNDASPLKLRARDEQYRFYRVIENYQYLRHNTPRNYLGTQCRLTHGLTINYEANVFTLSMFDTVICTGTYTRHSLQRIIAYTLTWEHLLKRVLAELCTHAVPTGRLRKLGDPLFMALPFDSQSKEEDKAFALNNGVLCTRDVQTLFTFDSDNEYKERFALACRVFDYVSSKQADSRIQTPFFTMLKRALDARQRWLFQSIRPRLRTDEHLADLLTDADKKACRAVKDGQTTDDYLSADEYHVYRLDCAGWGYWLSFTDLRTAHDFIRSNVDDKHGMRLRLVVNN